MRLVTAKLIRKVSSDGLVAFLDRVPLGKEYIIDADSLEEHVMHNLDKGVQHTKKIVWDEDHEKWLPADLLEWDGKAAQIKALDRRLYGESVGSGH